MSLLRKWWSNDGVKVAIFVIGILGLAVGLFIGAWKFIPMSQTLPDYCSSPMKSRGEITNLLTDLDVPDGTFTVVWGGAYQLDQQQVGGDGFASIVILNPGPHTIIGPSFKTEYAMYKKPIRDCAPKNDVVSVIADFENGRDTRPALQKKLEQILKDEGWLAVATYHTDPSGRLIVDSGGRIK